MLFGKVIDVDDPKQLGRVKVQVYGRTTQMSEDDIEYWAPVILPPTSAGRDRIGDTPRLEVDSRVALLFADSDQNIPVVIGVLPHLAGGDEERNSLPEASRGDQGIEKNPLGPEPANPYAAEYPHNRAIRTRGGHLIEIDDTPGAERIHFFHASGKTYIELRPDGSTVIRGEKLFIISQKDVEIYAEKEITIEAKRSKFKGDVIVEGEVKASKDVRVGSKSLKTC